MDDGEHGDAAVPSVDALIAGTVALMTLWPDPCPHCSVDLATQRTAASSRLASATHHRPLGRVQLPFPG